MKRAKSTTHELSFRQNKVLNYWIKGGRKNKAKAIRDAGYSDAMARQPNKVFGSPAVKEWFEQQGYNEQGIEPKHIPLNKVVAREEVIMRQEIVFEPSRLSAEQVIQLKALLDKIPDPQSMSGACPPQEMIPSYTPRGVGIDVFSVEAKLETRSSNLGSFSSM